jgi:hypothetical protein
MASIYSICRLIQITFGGFSTTHLYPGLITGNVWFESRRMLAEYAPVITGKAGLQANSPPLIVQRVPETQRAVCIT